MEEKDWLTTMFPNPGEKPVGAAAEAEALKQSLCDHLTDGRPGGWMTFREIPLGSVFADPTTQRADVLAISRSNTIRIVIYEVKRDRGDFLRDVQTLKYQGYKSMAHQVYFAAPSGLIKKEELPADVGLITLNPETRSWRSVVHAPLNSVDLNDPRFFRLWHVCLMRGQEQSIRVRSLKERVIWRENVALSSRARGLGSEIARRLAGSQGEFAKIEEVKREIDKLLGTESHDILQALDNLQVWTEALLSIKNIGLSQELLGVARDAVGSGHWSKERAVSSLERILSGLRNGGSR